MLYAYHLLDSLSMLTVQVTKQKLSSLSNLAGLESL